MTSEAEELNEIELAGSNYPGISNCCALFNPDNNQILFVYDSKDEFKSSNLKDFFNEKLPKYMVPDKFFYFSKLPLNSNGKIDRKKIFNSL